jgi:hypothetical protein
LTLRLHKGHGGFGRESVHVEEQSALKRAKQATWKQWPHGAATPMPLAISSRQIEHLSVIFLTKLRLLSLLLRFCAFVLWFFRKKEKKKWRGRRDQHPPSLESVVS